LIKLIDNKEKKISENALESKFRTYRFRSDRNFFSSIPDKERKLFSLKKAGPAKPKLNIQVYDCKNGTTLPGNPIKSGSKGKDRKNVLEGGKQTWNFYNSLFSRNSIDNALF
jgi:Zn-dependent metalloprotease